jgi:hypothetical protein
MPAAELGRTPMSLRGFRCLTLMAILAFSHRSPVAANSGKPQSAVEELAKLQEEAHAARVSGDNRAHLDTVLKIVKLLNNAPDAVEAAAQAYAEVGDNEHALAALREFADLGQVDKALLRGDDKKFAAIKEQPQYQTILKRFAENEQPISRAEQAFVLSDPGLLAEDIDYDPPSQSFLITSVLEKKIIRVTASGRMSDFASSPSHWPMLAIKVDADHKLVWATEVAMDGFTAAPKSDWGRSAVVCFDLRTGGLRYRLEGPPRSALGDMALTREGIPIVSDGTGGGVYRVLKKRLERIDDGAFISPQTSTMYPDGKRVFVPDYARGIGILDPARRQVKWLNQGEHAINGIDGLYFDHGFLIATQNGTLPERVIRFQLDSTLSRILAEEIIERSAPTLGDPTHGVVVGDDFYYIANSGWSNVDDHGDLKPGTKLTSARIMRYGITRRS